MSNILLAFFQVDLSDSESEEAGIESADKEDAMGRRKGDLGVNKKGTPLYSREDIREQYCINDKELQVLDKTGRKGILGCFSNNGQVSLHTFYSFEFQFYSTIVLLYWNNPRLLFLGC